MAGDLITLSKKRNTGTQCCGGDHILSCNLAAVNLELLGDESIGLPGGFVLDFERNVNNDPNSFKYSSMDGEAVITYNPNTKGLHGHALSSKGDSYVIEYCGAVGHVWKTIDTINMEGDRGLEFPGPKNRLALTFGEPEPIPELESPSLTFGEPELEPEWESPSLSFGGLEPELESPSLTFGGLEPESPSLSFGGSEPESPSLSLGGLEPESPSLSLGGLEPESPSLSLGGLEAEFPSLTLSGGETEAPATIAYVPLSGVESVNVNGEEESDALTLNLGLVGETVGEVTPPDNTTVVTYTVMFYYTAEVAADTADLEGFFDQVIAETNTGYENSNIPLRIKKHCSAQLPSSFQEIGASALLSNLTYWNTDPATTRNGADTAALIALNLDYCGVAWFNQLASGYTFSVTKKSCATGYYSFGHEIGHNIGAQHNPETSTNSAFDYAHGHLIAQGTANTGARTIMAYSATGHSTRVNYWSNPDINHPITSTATGVAGTENNAALLTLRRYTLASVADESTGGCYSATTIAPVTTAPVTTIPPVTNAPVTTMPPVTNPPVTTMPPVTNPPVTTMPPVTNLPVTMPPVTNPPVTTMAPPPPVTTAGPPPSGTPSSGPIECGKVIKSAKKKNVKATSAEMCQKKCQKDWSKGCIAFNFSKRKGKTMCQHFLLITKNNKRTCSGRPWA